MKKPIDKDYLANTLISFDAEVSEKKYLPKDDPSIHTHDNKTVLDKISASDKGTLLFDGTEVGNTDTSSSSTEYDILSTSSEVKGNAVAGKLVDALVIKEVFQCVSDGKELLASAITDKGVDTDANESFASMAEKIRSISCKGVVIPLAAPSDVTLTSNITSVTLKWTDPDDVIYKDVSLAEWNGTLVVRKVGSAPISKSDGIVVANSKIRNQYKTAGLTDDGLESGITYYYGIFPYTSNDNYNYEYTNSIMLSDIDINSEKVAPISEIDNWNYTLNDDDSVTLNYYNGGYIDECLTIYKYYRIYEKLYKTKLASFGENGTTDEKYMFANKRIFNNIVFQEGIDTSNVTNMSHMFDKCACYGISGLEYFDTCNVTNMAYMFKESYCGESLDLSSFNTSNVTNMAGMFFGCGYKSISGLNNWDVSKVIDMNAMFYMLKNLETLDLSNWKTTSLSGSFENMFAYNEKLKSITFGKHFDTSKITDFSYMFYQCKSLTSLDLTSFNTASYKDYHDSYLMFAYCENLESIYVRQNNWTITIESIPFLFNGCKTSSFIYV